jgi:hypothetical protein
VKLSGKKIWELEWGFYVGTFFLIGGTRWQRQITDVIGTPLCIDTF